MFYEVMVNGGGVGVLTYGAPETLVANAAADTSGASEGNAVGGNGAELAPGTIVEVPLRRGKAVGVVVKKVARPEFAVKPITRIIYSTPLPERLVRAALFVAEYYQAPLGSCVGLILPKGVEKQRRKTLDGSQMAPPEQNRTKPNASEKTEQPGAEGKIPLNAAQKNALQGLQEAPGATKLLYGVTGSGKTNIYLTRAAEALKRQKSVILLVPEIALTGQLVRVFGEVFGEIVTVMHSGQTEAERHLIFEKLLGADRGSDSARETGNRSGNSLPQIVIGPRSALFAPVKDLGLIIIDEEHESTYTQENAPRYSAIRVASYMASHCGCECILGSATPTVADYYLAAQRGGVVELAVRAKKSAKKAEIKVVDLKDRGEFARNRYFSNSLLASIKHNLEAGQQTLIFHNRRGSAPLTICDNCGHEMLCPNCYLPLTLHADQYVLQCHTCGYSEKVPMACPQCGSPEILHKGFGTKLLETELKRLFPKARVRRFDADTHKGEGLEAVYTEVRDGGVDILVGTQTLAKGLDLPLLATVGVVQADAGLCLPDYAAEERTFQLLTQVIGRVGRGHLDAAEVVIQTYRPEHPVVQYAVAEDYLGFYKYALLQRRKSGFPPFCFVAVASVTAKTEATALRKVRMVAGRLGSDTRLTVSPPMPAFHERTASGYTWQMVVRAKSRKALLEALSGLDSSWKVTYDPASLL